MPIQFATEPADGQAVLNAGLARALRHPGMAGTLSVAPTVAAAFPKTMKPLPIYDLNPLDILAGKGAEAAVANGWRYLINDGNAFQEAAEIYALPQSGRHQFGALTSAYVAGTEAALQAVDNFPPLQQPQAKYEMRILQAPALFFSSLWLKDLNGNDDFCVVIAPAPRGIAANVPCPLSDVYRILSDVAQKRMKAVPPQPANTSLTRGPGPN